MMHLPDQLILTSWRTELSSLTISLILHWDSTLHLLGTLIGKVPILPTIETGTYVARCLGCGIWLWLWGLWLSYRALRRVNRVLQRISRMPLLLSVLEFWGRVLEILTRRVRLIVLTSWMITRSLGRWVETRMNIWCIPLSHHTSLTILFQTLLLLLHHKGLVHHLLETFIIHIGY